MSIDPEVSNSTYADEFARAFESEETLTTIAEYATRLREKKSRQEGT